jgi:hypothetical protein
MARKLTAMLGGALWIFLGGALLISGCKSDNPMGDPEMEKKAQTMGAAAQRAGGDYNKLSPNEKQEFLKMSSGNEDAAKNLTHALSGKDHPEGENAGPPKR